MSLQLAAGIYKYIKETVSESFQQDLTPDLSTETLSALTYLMLAQAQEMFVLKAIHGSFLTIYLFDPLSLTQT